jgi:RimJ/RimL family protein N-acetyltransferase
MPDDPEASILLNITGEKVALGPHRRDLLPLYQKWINDFSVRVTIGGRVGPMTREAEEAWYEGVAKASGSAHFTIYEAATQRPIGTTALHDIDHFHRTAEFGIMIGEKDCWGKGYGTETARLMLGYGFSDLNLHNIGLRVFSTNARALAAYARAGFRECGRRRECLRPGGAICDEIFMECLATEFPRQP